MEHDDLAGRVARLEAREAIRDLKARYAALVDGRYVRGALVPAEVRVELARQVATLFTEDGVWDGGPALGVARGREEIAERLAEPTVTFARHLFVSPVLDVDGDRATGRWELLAPMTSAEGVPCWMQGVEEDVYERVEGEWLHASMRLTTTFVAPVTTGWERILA